MSFLLITKQGCMTFVEVRVYVCMNTNRQCFSAKYKIRQAAFCELFLFLLLLVINSQLNLSNCSFYVLTTITKLWSVLFDKTKGEDEIQPNKSDFS